jgi:multidrug efflux system outer membrane protein
MNNEARMKRFIPQYRWRSICSLGLVAVAIVISSGCAVGPNYKKPVTPTSPKFENAAEPGLSTNEIARLWWKEFNDPTLDELISHALRRNHDLRIATARLREARALRRSAQFDLVPSVNGNAGYSMSRISKTQLAGAPVPSREIEFYDAGFDATWELDLFGRVRRSVEANTAETRAAEASRRDVEISVISEVARNYFEGLGLQTQLRVARENVTNLQQSLEITEARLGAGRGTELDTARAKSQLNTTLAAVPPLEAAWSETGYRLAVLVGEQPGHLAFSTNDSLGIPTLPALVSIGTPETLLRRRPDIREAEGRLQAATARIGVAVADIFPRITFNGRVALEANSFSGLGRSGADAWSFGPRITWSALHFGHTTARIQAANAREEAALAAYEKTVLTALEETENALVNYGREQARRDYLKESVTASETAARLARERFQNGAADFLTVLDADRVLLTARDELAASETRVATRLVAVYKALGGGWSE